ncbi:hypothetical protein CVIRNUC_006984 [Coccomyxa viridis]|uniref:Sm domain-containing protein n=1 Tax=Coccomyxa viridis TaxID=1274662 RepID=A0AAV1ICU0_9CHLO|nr:hypothetical protein CVIRNUC_006984 [Coccomyxa viridis]
MRWLRDTPSHIMEAQPKGSAGQMSAKDVVHDILGTRLKVLTADGRVISGLLTCLDKQGNIVLQHAAQHLEPSLEERHLGTVIVPQNQRLKTQVLVMRNEAIRLNAQMRSCGIES